MIYKFVLWRSCRSDNRMEGFGIAKQNGAMLFRLLATPKDCTVRFRRIVAHCDLYVF